ncbi:MAG TPA: hypothetical protein VNK03_03610 [Gammaproteobacteria bacterium]|nr:hypothetical protein [Gammaproteobacteria bacterium]
MSVNAGNDELKKRISAPLNSITVPSHTSDTAQKQAMCKINEMTKYIMPFPSPSGEFELYKKNFQLDGQTGLPVCKINFAPDENGQERMTATFIKPIENDAIEAIALFSAHSQANLIMLYPKTLSGAHFNFKESSMNEAATKAFQTTYQHVHDQQKMTPRGAAVMDANITKVPPKQDKEGLSQRAKI